jgi:hypothetical protein
MNNLTQILTGIFEQQTEVANISFSAVAIGPELVTSSANIPDQEDFGAFRKIIDENLSSVFVYLFKKTSQIDGVTIDISFTYGNSTIILKLAGRKTKLKRGDNTDWFGLNMAELTINSKDTPIGSRQTFIEGGIKYLKKRKIKSYSKEYIGNLLEYIKGEIDNLSERTRFKKD